jgi:hypothetical protein
MKKPPATLAEWAATQKPVRRNKYGVAPKEQRTWRGVVYDSKREMAEGQSLCQRLERGEIKALERQRAFVLWSGLRGEIPVAKHVVDFVIEHLDGKLECVEVKSPATKTAVWRLKHKLFLACYPHIPYRIVE